jgi:hypothetical protein
MEAVRGAEHLPYIAILETPLLRISPLGSIQYPVVGWEGGKTNWKLFLN